MILIGKAIPHYAKSLVNRRPLGDKDLPAGFEGRV